MDDTSSAGDSAAENGPGFLSRTYKNYSMVSLCVIFLTQSY